MRITCIAFVLGLATLTGVARAQTDKILMKDGKEKTSVKIISEDYDGVRIELAGGNGTTGVRLKEIASVKFGSADKYNQALDVFNAGKLDVAQPLFEALAADTKQRPVIRHNVLYRLGLIYQAAGDADKAIAQFQEVLKTFPKTRYLLSIEESLLEIYLGRSDAASAQSALDSSFAAAQSAGMDPSLQAGFGVLRGRLLEQQKKYTEALTLYDTTSNASGAEPDVVAAAKLGAARSAQAAGNDPDATRRYKEVIVLDAPNSVLAGAWNGLGDLYMKEATAKRDTDGMRDALLAYLRGVVLYVPEREGSTEEYERALAGSARCFKGISELEADPKIKKDYSDRSKARLDQLKRDFPKSRFIPK
jgi:tetratricopeptide (TPR) repeat protein